MDDYRVMVGFLDHPKTRRLKRRLGPEAVEIVLRLWEFATSNPSRREGDLSGLDNEAIADTCRWHGDESQLVEALVDSGFLEGEPAAYRIHDWRDTNPYVATWRERSAQAKMAANARWGKPDAGSMPTAMLNHQISNAPSPSPSPSPDPDPTPDPDPKPLHARRAKKRAAPKQRVAESDVAFRMPLIDGEHLVSREDVDGWCGSYPAVDVPQALRSMREWCLSNPDKKKTPRGVRRFITGWLDREQNRGGNGASKPKQNASAFRQATNEIMEWARAEDEQDRIRGVDDKSPRALPKPGDGS